MTFKRNKIREFVESILEEHGIDQPPVPIKKIVSQLGIKLKYDKVDDELSGFLYRNKKLSAAIIGVNASHHENRKRFTIAHELGHYFLHEGQIVHVDGCKSAFTVSNRDSLSAKGIDPDEREANWFAAELLMPAKFIRSDLKDKYLDLLEDESIIEKMATKYKVSSQALTFRLANLGLIDL